MFPALSDKDIDDIVGGTLELRYSLIAASIPGLDNPHLMPQFSIEFVNDPVIFNLNETISYEPGSGMPLIIYVRKCITLHLRKYMHITYYI